MTRVAWAAVLALALAACGGSSHSTSRTIVLDHSIGPVKLLETRHDVQNQNAVGKGVTIRSDRHNGHQVRYSKLGLDVFYAPGPTDEEVAFALMTTSPRYRTREGIGVGSTQHEVASVKGVKCYGPTQCQHGATGPRVPGTAFAFRNGKAWRIAIATDFG